ncbi:hypothetical protein [Mucilaginibacter sp. HD30]
MKLRSTAKKLLKKLKISSSAAQTTPPPSIHDREVARCFADGGDEMFRYTFDLTSESLVIDLGGYLGQWASDIYTRYNCKYWYLSLSVLFLKKFYPL